MALSFKNNILIVTLLSCVLALTYANFSSYRPKILKRVQEVKGSHTQILRTLPYPENSQNISTNENSDSIQMTFETQRTPDALQQFYKTILLDDDWILISEYITQDSQIATYESENQKIDIKATTATDKSTIASIEIVGR